jgi:hypothetical protein
VLLFPLHYTADPQAVVQIIFADSTAAVYRRSCLKDTNVAKDLFLKYGGSFFHMDREGEYEKYRRFKVSKEHVVVK